jgi:hypothetical protein
MKKPKNQNEVAELERAIASRWGTESTIPPTWDKEKESEYLRQLKEKSKLNKESESEPLDGKGFLLYKKLVNTRNARSCVVCEAYSFSVQDDLYLEKFECCYGCYIRHVEGREEKWEERKRILINENNKKKT